MHRTEKEILDELQNIEFRKEEAKFLLVKTKKVWMEAETNLISLKIECDRVKEQLRVWRSTTVRYDPDGRDLEIAQFQQDHPELVKWARQRDGLDCDEE